MSFQRRHLLALPFAMQARALFAAPSTDDLVWPGEAWDRTTPEQAGWSPDAMAEARGYSHSIGSTSVVVVQHGRIVDSWGAIDRRIELHSVRKSLLSALIGIAVAQGRIDLDATLASLGIEDVPPALTDSEKQATGPATASGALGCLPPCPLRNPRRKTEAARAGQPCARQLLVLQQLGLQRARHDLRAGRRALDLREPSATDRGADRHAGLPAE